MSLPAQGSVGASRAAARAGAKHPAADDRLSLPLAATAMPHLPKRRLPARIRQPLAAPAGLNQIWAIDFMADALCGGRAFRTLNLIDEGNRQVLGIEVAHSIPSLRVIRVMEQLIEMHGKPRALHLDNGPEFTAIAFTEWCASHGIEARFIQPGKPDQNAFIERFNNTYRDEVLDAYVFESIEQVREVTETWLREYNEEPRPCAAPDVHAEANTSPGVYL